MIKDGTECGRLFGLGRDGTPHTEEDYPVERRTNELRIVLAQEVIELNAIYTCPLYEVYAGRL